MTILILVAVLIPLLIIGGVITLIYLLIKKNTHSMESKTKALDVFLYLGIAISLITSVYNFLQIVFTAIDRKFVDIVSTPTYVDMYNSDVRLAIASLVVMYPIYLGLSWYVSKDIAKFLYKRDLSIRKVMIYATLFITVITLIGTLVSVIYTYLGGELSVRFLYKALTITTVSAALFGYYYYLLKRNYSVKSMAPAIMTVATTLVVVASLVWSVSIVGTPAEMRAKRIDSTRLSDISGIQQQVFNHFQSTDKLPVTLGELNDAFQGYSVPVDPVTKESYVYTVTQQPVVRMNYSTNKKELSTSAIFELCATFETVRKGDSRMQAVPSTPTGVVDTMSMYSVSNYYYDGDQTPFWDHGVGKTCFKRVITSDMYYGGK
jgi:hypothetical protein